MNDTCANCGRKIEVAIFKNEDFCSVDCQKVLHPSTQPVTMAAASKEELEMLEKIRSEGYTLRKPRR